MGFWLVFIGLGGGDFEVLFAWGIGNASIKKIARGVCQGGWPGLELTDT